MRDRLMHDDEVMQNRARRRVAGAVTLIVAVLSIAAPTTAVRGDHIAALPAVSGGTAADTNGNGVFESVTGSSAVIRKFDFLEDRGLIEFDLSALPDWAIITGVTFEFRSMSIAENPERRVNILGYSGDGTISLDDATAPAVLLATYDSWNLGLGVQSVDLGLAGVAFLQSLLGTTGFAGLRLEGFADGTNTSIDGAPPLQFRPQLTVTYVPEPSSLTALGIASLMLLGYGGWRRTRSPKAA